MKKRVDLRDSSKLDPMISTLFFCALCALGRRCRPGLSCYCVVAPAGEHRFAWAKRAGSADYCAAAAAYPSARFCRSKNGDTNEQDTKEAVRVA